MHSGDPGPPRTIQETPGRHPRAHRSTQDAPSSSQETPSSSQEAPISSQEAPRMHPGVPRKHPGATRGTQETPRKHPGFVFSCSAFVKSEAAKSVEVIMNTEMEFKGCTSDASHQESSSVATHKI